MANLIVFCRFTSVYISSGPEMGVEVEEAVGIGVKVSLFLVGAFSTNLSLLARRELQQIRGLII